MKEIPVAEDKKKKEEDEKKKSATLTLGQKLNRRILEITGASKVINPEQQVRDNLRKAEEEEAEKKKKKSR